MAKAQTGEFRLPKRLSAINRDILKSLNTANDGLTIAELRERVTSINGGLVSRYLHNMERAGSVGRGKNAPIVWHISERGAYILEHIGQIEIYEATENMPGRRQPGKKKGPVKASDKQNEFEPIQHNISTTAESVADQIASLLDENAGYRDLMLKVYNTIGRALQLDKYAPQTENNNTNDGD